MKEGQLLDKYIPVTKMINRQDEIGFDEEFIKSLEEINYKLFIQISEINSITSNPKIKVLFERINPKHGDVFKILSLNDTNYIYMKKKGEIILIQDNNTTYSSSHIYIILVFAILFITIILVYLMKNLQKV
jgi:two-component system OmpR family sensor kinase